MYHSPKPGSAQGVTPHRGGRCAMTAAHALVLLKVIPGMAIHGDGPKAGFDNASRFSFASLGSLVALDLAS